ncbi:MAG: type II toxin-antitoxin system RelE/ParE family toxin [Pseudomonadota bacterium]
MAQQTIVETPEFIKRASAVGMSDEDRMEVIDQLLANQEAGISLGGGLRKVRVARRGGGKSAGYRVLFFYRVPDMPLFSLTVFAKNERANISRSEKIDLIKLCDLIADTYGAKP